MQTLVAGVFFGALGGIARAIQGILKHESEQDYAFDAKKFVKTIVVSGVVGGLVGLGMPDTAAIGVLGLGYGGSDFIEGLYSAPEAPAQAPPAQ